jgi:glycerol-3-phosphate dehydrogenase (NAD+)
MLTNLTTRASRATQRLAQNANHLKTPPAVSMATLGAPEKRHKVTVVGSGNWYVYFRSTKFSDCTDN